MAKSVNEAKQNYQNNFEVISTYMMPEYERQCISEYLRDE